MRHTLTRSALVAGTLLATTACQDSPIAPSATTGGLPGTSSSGEYLHAPTPPSAPRRQVSSWSDGDVTTSRPPVAREVEVPDPNCSRCPPITIIVLEPGDPYGPAGNEGRTGTLTTTAQADVSGCTSHPSADLTEPCVMRDNGGER